MHQGLRPVSLLNTNKGLSQKFTFLLPKSLQGDELQLIQGASGNQKAYSKPKRVILKNFLKEAHRDISNTNRKLAPGLWSCSQYSHSTMIAKLFNWENAYIEICYSQWFSFLLNISSLTILFFWYLGEHVELLQSMYSHLAHSRSMTMLLEGTSKRGRGSLWGELQCARYLWKASSPHASQIAWHCIQVNYETWLKTYWFTWMDDFFFHLTDLLLIYYGIYSCVFMGLGILLVFVCHCYSFCCCLFVCFLKRKHGVQWVRSIWEEMREEKTKTQKVWNK